MLTFHNDPAIKAKYIDRVSAHRKADELSKDWMAAEAAEAAARFKNYRQKCVPGNL